jgi:hypothetical protein
VMVSNIYISDRTNKIKSGLRANHQGFQSLSTDFDDAWELFSAGTQVFSLVEQFCKDHPYFSKTVAHEVAKAQFNPIADYYADRDKARRLSQNAGHRDLAGVIEQMRQIVGI